MSIATIASPIDALLDRPVLVIGSLPPYGRDLDLLAAEPEYTKITGWLAETGFVPRRNAWVSFDAGSAAEVDVSAMQRWGRSAAERSTLLQDAETITGYRNLLQPGPAVVLLLAARGMVARRGRITDKVRRRVDDALQRDPDAWRVAEQQAVKLGMVGALHLLRRAHDADRPLPLVARAAGLGGVVLRRGPLPAKARILVDARPRGVRPAVVSFSGLDGSGKSTQVASLRTALEELGVRAEIQWAGFKTAAKIRRALPILERTRRGRLASSRGERRRDPLVPAACLGSAWGRHVWACVVVAANAVSLWRYVLVPRRGVQVVIFDRFTPDTAVKLDFHYGLSRDFEISRQRELLRRLSPKPDVGFLIAVPSEVAYARRQDQTPQELRAMARLYDDQVPRFDLIRLDGTQRPESLSRSVIVAAWHGLP